MCYALREQCAFFSEEHVDPVSQELADATSHQFVRGKWSYIEQDEEFSFKILDSSIAASGQCSNLINYLGKLLYNYVVLRSRLK